MVSWSRAVLIVAVCAVVFIGAWAGSRRSHDERDDATPSTHVAYVANDLCVGCHQAAAKDWSGSHHAKAMAPATDATVVADFDGTTFARDGVVSRFMRRDG